MQKLEVVLLVVALLNVGIVLEFVRRRELQEGFALLWIFTGLAGVALALGRSLVDEVAEAAGVTYGANFILGACIGFLGLVSMSLSRHVSRLEKQVERLAEEVAFLRSPVSEVEALREQGDGENLEGSHGAGRRHEDRHG